ncbi:unnamed protein product [Schistocephalus solidus]|uniref:LEM domain-containing protein n=1 Tax=Schistocephalus solidus TaxID=70667 RepID=A0A183T202_SCHSO|nr:unnamed protein product [Schistocephalus solidus]
MLRRYSQVNVQFAWKMSSLSDEELRSSLRDHGVHVGPITETTRKVYERKLAKVTAQNVDKEEKVRLLICCSYFRKIVVNPDNLQLL